MRRSLYRLQESEIMSYQRERDEFIARMTREGLPIDVTRLLLREATGLNRRAEMACSSEAADRDRVKCPAAKRYGLALDRMPEKPSARYPCLCDTVVVPGGEDGNPTESHTTITRITLQDYHAEQRITKALAAHNVRAKLYTGNETQGALWEMDTQGDPRGYVLRIIPPSYAERNKGRDRDNRDTIGVPAGPSGIRW